MDRILSGEANHLQKQQQDRELDRQEKAARAVKPKLEINLAEKSDVKSDNPVPFPPFWGRREVTSIPLAQIFPYINTDALFLGQWGFKKKALSESEQSAALAEIAQPVFDRLQRQAVAEKLLDPKVVYGYFPVQSKGDDLIVFHTEEFQGCTCHAGPCNLKPTATPREWLRFTFPRQNTRRRLCIADFFRSQDSGEFDILGLQLVTVGDRASELAAKLFAANQYQEYLYLHGFGVESAEALAELWHKRMRQELGFGSEDSPKIHDLFRQGYRGSRFSFGYGACPSLEDRAKIIQLLKPESIGVQLTENHMLVPEQSTDALVVHHPQAKYFDVD
jgi:5-methyltetrahydrofolate--homocysteine methyltransferase